MRVRNLDSESNALTANFTFSHFIHRPFDSKEEFILSVTDNIITEIAENFKGFFIFVSIFMQNSQII